MADDEAGPSGVRQRPGIFELMGPYEDINQSCDSDFDVSGGDPDYNLTDSDSNSDRSDVESDRSSANQFLTLTLNRVQAREK